MKNPYSVPEMTTDELYAALHAPVNPKILLANLARVNSSTLGASILIAAGIHLDHPEYVPVGDRLSSVICAELAMRQAYPDPLE